MDKLKQYLEEHKAEMDVDLPPGSVWQNIQAASSRQTVIKRLPILMRYAAAVLLITVGAGVWVITATNEQKQVVQVPEKEKPARNIAERVLQKKDSKKQPAAIEQVASVESPKTPSPRKGRQHQSKLIFDDVAAIDKSYAKLIAYQIRRLRRTPVYPESPGYFTAFVGQLDQMDKDEQAVRGDIARYGINDQLLESLINIYQQKLNLLKSLQKEIRQMNNSMQGKQSADSLRPYYLNL